MARQLFLIICGWQDGKWLFCAAGTSSFKPGCRRSSNLILRFYGNNCICSGCKAAL